MTTTRPTDAPPHAALVIAGAGPDRAILAREAARLGVDVASIEAPADGPLILVTSVVDIPALWESLTPPLCGLIEPDDDGRLTLGAPVIAAAQRGGIGMSLTTKTAYRAVPAEQLAAALVSRQGVGTDAEWKIELAVQEAVTNGLIHGNLGIDSGLRRSLCGMKAFGQLLTDRLAEPRLAARRIVVVAVPTGDGIEVTVTDEGAGFDFAARLEQPVEREATSGRGLGIIRKIARSVRYGDGGRSLHMLF